MFNPHVKDLVETIKRKYSVDRVDMSLGDWICENTKLRGKNFTFDRYPFQKQIADDMHENLSVIKLSQVGLTEVQIRKALAMMLRMDGFRLIFTMPNNDMRDRISTTRINPLVDEDEVFHVEPGTKATRTKEIKQFGRSFLYLTGSSEGDATSIDADGVFNDEIDLTPQDMLALFSSRLQNSDYKIRQQFSTPTHEGFGISSLFDHSDQHFYLCKCDVCNHYNDPQFTPEYCHIPGLSDDIGDYSEIEQKMLDTLSLDNAYVKCAKCGSALDLGRTDNREWVPAYPGRDHARGYRVRPFSTNRIDIKYIVTQLMTYKRLEFIRGWHNTVIGEPFTEAQARLTEDQIKSCMGTPQSIAPKDNRLPIFVGIDVGALCHITIGTPKQDKVVVWKMEVVPSSELLQFIELLGEEFHIVGGAIDRLPYTPTAEAVRDLSKHRIYPVQYMGSKEIAPQYDSMNPDEIDYLQANRTKMIDTTARHVRKGLIELNGYGTQEQNIIDHLRDMVRDEEPEKPAVWKKLTGQDHFFHSIGYMLFAIKMQKFIANLGTHDPRTAVIIHGANKLPDSNNKKRLKDSGLIGFTSSYKSGINPFNHGK